MSEPWWQVDLGSQQSVDVVRLYQRIEASAPYSTELSDFYVFLSPTPFGNQTVADLVADPAIEHAFHAGSFFGASLDMSFQNTAARYVRVQSSGLSRMVLAEVEILQAANGMNQPQEEGGVHFFVNDHLMTPQMAVNRDNVVTWQAEYTSFGKTDISVEQFVNNHRFPGQYYDSESGLYYNWHRYYDPQTGRYLTSDPIGLRGGLNTFGYVGGNPVGFTDPTGQNAVGTCVAGLIAEPGPFSEIACVCYAVYRIGSAIKTLVTESGGSCAAPPDNGPKDSQPKQCDDEDDCDKEWREARRTCRDLIMEQMEQMEQRAGRRKKRSVTGVTGGFTDVESCAAGLVSERCGGNKKDYGRKKKPYGRKF
ncbi:hypothetical protein NBRC116583_02010 [Arenicella sp. 4NH20-0111]|uniref:RHS repeat-associated core domain-containing protein n=1 Tax=Arenicella sp. 4NH20-0111 TaxID=3127648 RepID=UPI00310250DC